MSNVRPQNKGTKFATRPLTRSPRSGVAVPSAESRRIGPCNEPYANARHRRTFGNVLWLYLALDLAVFPRTGRVRQLVAHARNRRAGGVASARLRTWLQAEAVGRRRVSGVRASRSRWRVARLCRGRCHPFVHISRFGVNAGGTLRGAEEPQRCSPLWPNPFIERTALSQLRWPKPAAHVER